VEEKEERIKQKQDFCARQDLKNKKKSNGMSRHEKDKDRKRKKNLKLETNS